MLLKTIWDKAVHLEKCTHLQYVLCRWLPHDSWWQHAAWRTMMETTTHICRNGGEDRHLIEGLTAQHCLMLMIAWGPLSVLLLCAIVLCALVVLLHVCPLTRMQTQMDNKAAPPSSQCLDNSNDENDKKPDTMIKKHEVCTSVLFALNYWCSRITFSPLWGLMFWHLIRM